MYRKIEVNAEHNEIILENSHGDKVIIPANKRSWVKQKLSEGCHDCIDSLVETLPVASQYAQDGTVYPVGTKVKVNQDNQIKEYDISSPEYKDLYNSGKLTSYDKTSDSYITTPLKEVTVTAEAPQWLEYKREYEKTNPKSNYVNQYLTPFAKSLGNTETNYPERLDDEYEQKSLDYVSEHLVKNKPQGKLSRAEWLNSMSDKEEELVKRNPKYQSSLWADTKRGLTSLVEQHPLQTFQNILTSSDYSNREKREMLKDYVDHPIMSKLGDAAKILNPLTVPSKMVQSAYKDDYSFTDALKGKKNDAGIVEDIITDPLNLIGLGIWGKLSKANNFAKLEDAYQAIKTLDKTTLEKQIGTTLSNDDWQYLYRVQEKGFDIEKPTLKAIEERVSSGKGKWYDNNILNNPELRANMESRDRYYGQWFEQDPKRLDYYLADKEDIEILRAKVPKEILEQYRIDKFDPEIAKKWSLSHETEYIIPKDLIQKAEKFKRNDWQKLIDEQEAIKSKVLDKTDDVVKTATSSVGGVSKSVKPAWQMQELPGLHLKSTMEGEAISKIVEPKTGLVNVEQALAIIGKESGGADKVALIKQGLGNNIPKKMDYNDFRKTVQDQLIPLERQFATNKSDYGIDRIGYYDTDDAYSIKKTWEEAGFTRPIENQTLILGNKGKFGRGSNAHGNPDETLGHIHFLRDAETPDVLTVTQIQSDAFQGTHRIMPDKSKKVPEFFKQREEQRIQNLKKSLEEDKVILNKYKTNKVDNDGYPIYKSQIEQIEESVRKKEQEILFKDADLKNLPQKQLLDKNHQERYLQELVDYAGKRGDVNKVRVPTSETAAKVQGYSKIEMTKNKDFVNPLPNNATDAQKVAWNEHIEARISGDKSKLKIDYSPEHQTILKKYSEQPKTIKKLFGKEPQIVTDSKGNTWYEFDIPKKFKEGKGEIKAFGLIPPAIGIGTAIQSQQNKSEQ